MKTEIDYFMENAKVILIFMVVIGHFTVVNSDIPMGLNLFFTSFRMPAFIFVCGYFAKRKNLVKDLKKLLIPYLILQIVWFLFNRYYLGHDNMLNFFMPAYTLWFLLSIFIMKQTVHFFDKLKYPLTTLFIISILIGYTPYIGTFLSLSRTIVFFPFFYMGFKFKRDEFIEKTEKNKYKILAFSGLIILLLIAYNNQDIFTRELFFGKRSYVTMLELKFSTLGPLIGYIGIFAGLSRIIQYIFSTIAIYLFFILVPKEKNIFSYIGRATFGVYVIHPFFVQALRNANFFHKTDFLSIMSYYILAIIVTLILSTKIANKIIGVVFKVPVEKLFKPTLQK